MYGREARKKKDLTVVSRCVRMNLRRNPMFSLFQSQYDKTYSYFRTTTELFDFLEWNGKILNVWNNDKIIEIYRHKDLETLNIF